MLSFEELQESNIFSQLAFTRAVMTPEQREKPIQDNVKEFSYPFTLERKMTSIISKEIYTNHIKPFKQFVKRNYDFWKDSYALRNDADEDLDYISLAIDEYFKNSPGVFLDESELLLILEDIDLNSGEEWATILKKSLDLNVGVEGVLSKEALAEEMKRVITSTEGILLVFQALVTDVILTAVVAGSILKKVNTEVHKASNRARGRTDPNGNTRRQTEEEFISRNVTSDTHSKASEKRMKEALVEVYKWSTAGDERVRGNPSGTNPGARFSHYLMDGIYKQIDDPSQVSRDAKKWRRVRGREEPRHAGRAANCRCTMIPSFIRIIQAVDQYVA